MQIIFSTNWCFLTNKRQFNLFHIVCSQERCGAGLLSRPDDAAATSSPCCSVSRPSQGRRPPPSPPVLGKQASCSRSAYRELVTGPCSEQHTGRSHGSELRMGTRGGSPDRPRRLHHISCDDVVQGFREHGFWFP